MPVPRKVSFRLSWPVRDETPGGIQARLRAMMDGLRVLAPYAEPLYVEGLGRVLGPGHGESAALPLQPAGGETRIFAGGPRARLCLRAGVSIPGAENHVRLDLHPPEGELGPSAVDRVLRLLVTAFDSPDVTVTDSAPGAAAA